MKKWEQRRDPAHINAAKRRWLRALATKSIKSPQGNQARKIRKRALIDKILAPSNIDIQSAANQKELFSFVKATELKVREACEAHKKRKIRICFRNTRAITSSGGLWLLAKFEEMVTAYPNTRFTVIKPPDVPNHALRGKAHIVDSVFNRIGLYELLGQRKRNMREISSVKCWSVVSDTSVVGHKLGELLKKITDGLNNDYQSFYRPLVEAVSNSVEHAYRDDLYKDSTGQLKKWWCFASVQENNLILLICDLGVGIPKTLSKTQSSTSLEKLGEIIGRAFKSDGDYIEASLQVRKTSTGESNRGKGGRDFQSVIEEHLNSSLSIHSNKGYLKLINNDNTVKSTPFPDRDSSIGGTILQWDILLPQKTLGCL